jgi:hypothetical protein
MLFKRKRKYSSYTQKYAEEYMEKYGNQPADFSYKWLMVNLTHLILLFGRDLKISFEIGDKAFFELNCFIYVHIDYWISKETQFPREAFIEGFTKEFEALYNPAFGINNARELFEDRFIGYATVLKETRGDNEKLILHLKNLINISNEEKAPINYNFSQPRLPYSDFFDSHQLHMHINSWLESCIPSVLGFLELFIENNE